MTLKKKKYCFISVYAPKNESTVKDPEKKTRTFYENLTDIVNKITSILIGGDFNARTKTNNHEPLLNKILGKYAKNSINEDGKKLI